MEIETTTRDQRLATLLDLHTWENAEEWDEPKADARYALVERSNHGGGFWLTLHDSPELAGSYADGQEAPEDWWPEYLYDLDTGAHLWPERVTTFAPQAVQVLA